MIETQQGDDPSVQRIYEAAREWNGSKRVCGPKNDKDAEAMKRQTGDDIY